MVTGGNLKQWDVGDTMIQFGEWLPDQPDYNNNGVTVATNVVPAANGYTAVQDFVAYSAEADSNILGIFAAKSDSGEVSLFAGDAGKIYKFNQTGSALDDVSKAGSPAYGLASGERWKFVQFGDTVIAAGGIDEELQKFQLGTDSAFSDLSGTPPKADFLAVVRDFVWTANIDVSGDRKPYRCYWSGFNDSTSWTSGTDQSDFQDIPDAGAITGLVGGEYATILMERAIVRATYTGPPLIWQFDKVETARGCQVPGSVCNIGHLVFYLSDDGFYVFNGSESTPIGAEKVNRFFFDDFNFSFKEKMTSTVDPQQQLAVWSYVSNSSIDGSPDRMLIYNYAIGRWSVVDIKTDLLAPFFTAGYTLENLDQISASIDTLPASLDNALYKGGQFLFGGARGKKIFSFTGDPLDGVIETAESGISTGNHNLITRAYPYHRGGSVTMQIGTRDLHSEDVTYTSEVAPNSNGFAPFRAQGRYHRLRFNISGDWEYAQGADVEVRKIGRR